MKVPFYFYANFAPCSFAATGQNAHPWPVLSLEPRLVRMMGTNLWRPGHRQHRLFRSDLVMSTPIILVVEDRQAEQYVLQHLLKKFKYDVQVMSTAEPAIDAVRLGTFSAVLMDLTLPGMSGIECAKQIRAMEEEMDKHTPIIAVTAKSEETDKKACIEAGMDDYLIKPFTPDQLRMTLARFITETPQLI